MSSSLKKMNSVPGFEYSRSENGGRPPESATTWQGLPTQEETALQTNDATHQAHLPVTYYEMNIVQTTCTACGAGSENQVIIPIGTQLFSYKPHHSCACTDCSSSYAMSPGPSSISGGSFLDNDISSNSQSFEHTGMVTGHSNFQNFGANGYGAEPAIPLLGGYQHILLGDTAGDTQIDKRWPCPDGCGKSFSRKGDAKRHAQNHAHTRRFRCWVEECKFSKRGFARRDKFLSHLRKAHNITENPDVVTPDSMLLERYTLNSI